MIKDIDEPTGRHVYTDEECKRALCFLFFILTILYTQYTLYSILYTLCIFLINAQMGQVFYTSDIFNKPVKTLKLVYYV